MNFTEGEIWMLMGQVLILGIAFGIVIGYTIA